MKVDSVTMKGELPMGEQQEDKVFPKTLLVTWSFPPALIGSSQVAAGVARHFSNDELAVAAERWPGKLADEWLNESRMRPYVFFIHRQWPWRFKKTVRLLFLPIVLLKLTRVFLKTRAEQILVMFPSEYYLFLSWLVARIFRVPLVSYFHNTYLENRTGPKRWFANWLQPRIFRDSKVVFVMSDGMRDALSGIYPSTRFRTLVHTSEERALPLGRQITPTFPLKIGFLGSVNESNRDALKRIGALLEQYPNTKLTAYGNTAPQMEALGFKGNFTNKTVSDTELITELRTQDFLFLPHGFSGALSKIEYKTIFPTRTIPYLQSGIPIVLHAPKDSFITKWLRKHDCAEIVDEPVPRALVAAFERLAEDHDRCLALSRNAQKAADEFSAQKVIEILRQNLSNHL